MYTNLLLNYYQILVLNLYTLSDILSHLVINRRTRDAKDLKVGNFTFQVLTDFKYLGTNINNTKNMHNDIKLRISAAYKKYFAMGKCLSENCYPKDQNQPFI